MSALPRQCAILAGGLGTRLGAMTRDTPKPLLDVAGRPFLAWLMREAMRWGIEEFVLLTGHLSERVDAAVEALAASLPHAVTVRVSREDSPAGTGGALRQAAGLLDETFLLLNGDSILFGNLGPTLAAFARDDASACRMVLREVADGSRYGVATLEGDRLTAFGERGTSAPALINAGVYLMTRAVAERAAPICSLERDVLPPLVAQGLVRGTAVPGWFIDIGVPDDLARARADVRSHAIRPALMLDRDGVLNRDHHYVSTRERWEWMDGAIEAVSRATAAGNHVFVVTNQAGIARGFYSEAQMHALHRWMADTIRANGGTIDDLRYCPHHPDGNVETYRRVSNWRKPAPGMILDLLRTWELDPSRCVLIGDKATDMAAAKAAGIEGRLFEGGNLAGFVSNGTPGLHGSYGARAGAAPLGFGGRRDGP